MSDYEIQEFEIDIDDLFKNVTKNVKKATKDFEDLLNYKASLDREILLGDIEYGTGSDVDAIIRFWNKYDEVHNTPIEKRQPIKIYIDSAGGSLTDTLTIIDAIKMSKTPVWTIATGMAYSGGFFSFIAGHKRIAYSHTSFLFHEGSASNGGTSGQFENYTQFYKKQLKQLEDIVLENTKITAEEYQKIKRDDIWYDAQEALEKGIIDEIAEEFA